ncbi:MAG: hypothetical protein JSW73_03820 [Candidatus Woesearchaeota archaeon]|nr:MAG: hypothetical protein JSW73_03820 [Candidatus Woesearchaeota archaeon]
MKYKEYLTKLDGTDKKLGILGEAHLYTKDESKFAKELVPNFDIVASEGSNREAYLHQIGILYVPLILAYVAATNRSFNNKRAIDIAERHGKKIITLDDSVEELFSIPQKLAIGLSGAISIPLSPFIYVYYKLLNDPSKRNNKAYKRIVERRKKGKKSLSSKFFSYAFTKNMNVRDKVMAENSVKILKERTGDLLVVCGELHLDGIIDNLQKTLELSEVRSFPEESNENPQN